MSLHVVVMPRAERESTKWWTENRSPEQATRWWDGILKAIETLGENPHRCPLARENNKHPCELRELHYGVRSRSTHRVLFTIRSDKVVVITVQHASQQDFEPDEL